MQGLDEPTLQAAMDGRYDGIRAMVKSADFVEGPRAFAEKRRPSWSGK